MGWIGILVAGGLFLGSGAYLIGSVIPSCHRVSSTIFVPADRYTVFMLVSDRLSSADWRRDVEKVEWVEDHPYTGGVVWVEHTKNGKIPIELVDEDPSLVVTRIVDQGMPFGGTWTIEIEEEGEGSRVVITEEGFVRSPMFRVIGALFLSRYTTMDCYLCDLAIRFGVNDPVAEHVDKG